MSDRPVHTDALATLGSIIGDAEKRDAIHIAVEPVVAAHRLRPGEHVALNEAGYAVFVMPGEGVGIVDPFLIESVMPGSRFWLLVYPRQITSLRHVWEHPAFSPSQDVVVADASVSELWLRRFIPLLEDDEDWGITLHGILSNAVRRLDEGDTEYFHFDGVDSPSGGVTEEFLGHVETYLGVKITARPEYFSCAC